MCQKLLSHGKSKQKGCIKDGKCKNFHPPMCRSSLSKRRCTNQNCEVMHIKGTKRFQHQNVPDASETLNRIAASRHTKPKNMKSVRFVNRKSPTRRDSEDSHSDVSFLEKNLSQPKPPLLETGSGCGGEQKQTLMDLLHLMIKMQNQQLQLLQSTQPLQGSPQIQAMNLLRNLSM